MVVKSWLLFLITAWDRKPLLAEDYHVGFETSFLMRNQGAIHINMDTSLMEVLLQVFFVTGLVNLPQWGCQPSLVCEILRWQWIDDPRCREETVVA